MVPYTILKLLPSTHPEKTYYPRKNANPVVKTTFVFYVVMLVIRFGIVQAENLSTP
jgi:hypothetical protein